MSAKKKTTNAVKPRKLAGRREALIAELTIISESSPMGAMPMAVKKDLLTILAVAYLPA